MEISKKDIFNHSGYCSICEEAALFTAKNPWSRDNLFCSGCSSIPRERALMKVVTAFYPNWRDLAMHESSPGDRGASAKRRSECKDYVASLPVFFEVESNVVLVTRIRDASYY